jgi:hypothetical protein
VVVQQGRMAQRRLVRQAHSLKMKGMIEQFLIVTRSSKWLYVDDSKGGV